MSPIEAQPGNRAVTWGLRIRNKGTVGLEGASQTRGLLHNGARAPSLSAGPAGTHGKSSKLSRGVEHRSPPR